MVFTWDPDFAERFWLSAEYLPAIAALNRSIFAPVAEVAGMLGGATVEVVEIPADCADGFLCAYWRRPEAFLDPSVRAGISSFSDVAPHLVTDGLRRLARDLESGAFWARHADLRDRSELDLGYRLLVSDNAT